MLHEDKQKCPILENGSAMLLSTVHFIWQSFFSLKLPYFKRIFSKSKEAEKDKGSFWIMTSN
jgi:hypothetical protein